MTLRLTVNGSDDEHALEQAADIIRAGGLVAFPTETVYGLGADATNERAVRRIFEAKERPTWDPLICHASDLAMLRRYAAEWPQSAEALAAAFMPGPITLLLAKAPEIASLCTAGRPKVGLRIPSHPIARRLIELSGVPIAAPSANRFGYTSPTTAEHVLHDLEGRLDAILDAGPTPVGVESTVIDPSAPPTIYRPGGLSREQIEAVLGPVRIAQKPMSENHEPAALESPGLGIRHYAPRARVLLVEDEDTFAFALQREREAKLGAMLPAGWKLPRGVLAMTFEWGSMNDSETLARRLYQGLRSLDAQGAEVIIAPLPSPTGLGLAIRDRLQKAAWKK
ncbi:MAG TPA: L-threonylcarbamoyladenylate synthase [Candidatus Acidoferrales bacterium]|nr:L-threonylcarbamoyladenylate synthase [Candidatus Acidoferrales bacterium]